MFSSQLINALAETVIQSENKDFDHLPDEIKLKGVIEDVTIEQMTLEPISVSPRSTTSDEKWDTHSRVAQARKKREKLKKKNFGEDVTDDFKPFKK